MNNKLLITSFFFFSMGVSGAAAGNITAADTLVPTPAQTNGVIEDKLVKKFYDAASVFSPAKEFAQYDFKKIAYGSIPGDWLDLYGRKPSRNWIVDEQNFLRPVLKAKAGLIALDRQDIPANIRINASFKKAEDSTVFFSIAGRIQDRDNFYAVSVVSDNRLAIYKMKDGNKLLLAEMMLLRRINFPELWRLTASFYDDLVTGVLYDAQGKIAARIDARDGEFSTGRCGLFCTDYASAADFTLLTTGIVTSNGASKALKQPGSPVYARPLIKPVQDPEKYNTPFSEITGSYDVIVAGSGTGGWAAAIQAARMGMNVLLLEETDWIGGQMAAAAVTSMDESGPSVRERGIYREFHESMTAYYYSQDKCPFMAYYHGWSTQNQTDGGYEPVIARKMLYGFIQDAREHGHTEGSGRRLDLLVRTQVKKVIRSGSVVNGVDIEQWNEGGKLNTKRLTCKILIDATEYGDVIPLTGAPYRVGNTKSTAIAADAVAQDNTFTGVIREYPEGIPEHLRIRTKPPGYDDYRGNFVRRVLYGDAELHRQGFRNYRAEIAWRGMADTKSTLTGRISEYRHTLAGINGGGNDYKVPVKAIESKQDRLINEREGVYRTLCKIYYYQNELKLPWAVAEDQGFNTSYNREMMRRRGITDSLLDQAAFLSQVPYVRESRRLEGMDMLVADHLKRGDSARHVPTAIAIGDYFMDLHHTYEALEKDLDHEGYTHDSGPFQIPFAVFIPKDLDGFLPAEKNFSQSRLVSGATRLQPITMLTGQAVGTIAALSVQHKIQPRKLKTLAVQLSLLQNGATLVPRWYLDIDWGTDLWMATQLMSLYGILDKPGKLSRRDGMEIFPAGNWSPGTILSRQQAVDGLTQLAKLLEYTTRPVKNLQQNVSGTSLKKIAAGINSRLAENIDQYIKSNSANVTHGEFALLCLSVLKNKYQR